MKAIICECKDLSEKLIHYLLNETESNYKQFYLYEQYLEEEWGWITDDNIPDTEVIKEWLYNDTSQIITVPWPYEKTIQIVEEAQINNVHIYTFCKHNFITNLPF